MKHETDDHSSQRSERLASERSAKENTHNLVSSSPEVAQAREKVWAAMRFSGDARDGGGASVGAIRNALDAYASALLAQQEREQRKQQIVSGTAAMLFEQKREAEAKIREQETEIARLKDDWRQMRDAANRETRRAEAAEALAASPKVKQEHDLGGVSPTEVDSVPCLVPTDAASHDAMVTTRGLMSRLSLVRPENMDAPVRFMLADWEKGIALGMPIAIRPDADNIVFAQHPTMNHIGANEGDVVIYLDKPDWIEVTPKAATMEYFLADGNQAGTQGHAVATSASAAQDSCSQSVTASPSPAQTVEQGWQPIETAEKNTDLWCWDRVEGYYHAKLIEVNEFLGVGKGSRPTWTWHNKSANRYSTPTHWRPLPHPPLQKGRETA